MTVKATIRRHLDKVQGATTAARLVLETIRSCLRYRVTGLASEAAFFMLLSLPPLVLALFGGVGYVGQLAGRQTVAEVTEAIREYAGRFLTQESISQVILPTVGDVFRGGRFELVSLGFLLALWSGSRALNVFIDTIAIMYGQSGVRGIVRTRALSFSLYLMSMLFGVVVLPLMLIGPTLLGRWLPEPVHFVGLLYWPFVVAATLAALTTLFHIATPRRSPWWRDLPGACVAMTAWVVASFVVRALVAASLGGASIYGPLSAPIVVLIWLYTLAIAVLIGAGVNAATRVIWPVQVRSSSTVRLVAWARQEVERRRSSFGPDEQEALFEAEEAYLRQYLDDEWTAAGDDGTGSEQGRRRAS